jgi:hypothetical membrane protein
MLFVGTALTRKGEKKMAAFSFIAAIFSIIVWVVQYTVGFGKGVAIPETLTSLSVSAWALVLGFKILKQPKQQY